MNEMILGEHRWYTPQLPYTWRVEDTKTHGFMVYRDSHEKMCIDASGTVYFGKPTPWERMGDYALFQTKEFAEAHARFCNRTEQILYEVFNPPIEWAFTNSFDADGSKTLWGNPDKSFPMRLKVSPQGDVVYVDLPFMVKAWLKAELMPVFNKFFYGQLGPRKL